MSVLKPKLSFNEQIDKLKGKGIQFNFRTEDNALGYLRANNNFYKLTSYRKNFEKIQNGLNKGKYHNLDFGYLVDLAIIDTRLRVIVLEMALNIEHFAKVELLQIISEDSNEDGYTIIQDYIAYLTDDQHSRLYNEINKKCKSEYCGDIINKYHDQYPVWAFVEILSFGDFLFFYKYCVDKYNYLPNLKENYYLMLNVKCIRNAAAHNNCVINDLLRRPKEHDTNLSLLRDLAKNTEISKQVRSTQLGKMRVQQLVSLLYAHKTIVTSAGVHRHISERLKDLSNRFFRDFDYRGCEPLKNSLEFLKNVIDFWFKIS